ncbi:hypothetical protein GA0115240_11214 [Streptomyces sp. DvalAA-14]|uniref:hypothetical protein n=1 Tax=unclassified Streptomyces TaxID=2593676 RepID=UPI00081B416C|nr:MULTISPECIES: hypothetical protein [unclassified Streptomyces]MYS19702.1 hypothetical protein [Streptomyces sp. SID4948]SCD51101.1 hypothetical protein GA0115240_11214 [Streptomyces sp. DvalAA-14]
MSTGSAVLSDRILSQSVETATIHAPLTAVDIADWLFTLPDQEYQRCAPPDHKAAGYTSTDDGRPMSINVEMIGSGLVIQHYVAEVAEKQHCHMVSLSDVLTPNGWTTVQVVWDLSAKDNGDGTVTYTNSVTSRPTAEFLEFCELNGVSFEQAARERQAASGDHCRRETPLFAASIERHARSRRP